MGADTKIQWADHTFNPWRGCSKIAAGCANCYAEALSKRNPGTLGVWGPNGTRVVASEAMWREPLKWDREAAQREESYQIAAMTCRSEYDIVEAPERPRVFCASLADVFEDWKGVVCDSNGRPLHRADAWGQRGEWVGVGNTFLGRSLITLDDVRARLFRLIDATPNLDWLLLTKRPKNVRRMWPFGGFVHADAEWDRRVAELPPLRRGEHYARPSQLRRENVWLGVSIACQDDLRLLDELRKCRDLCVKTFVSAEPLLEDLGEIDLTGIDWVIVGGESGPNARPCNVKWVRSIVRQCRDAGVPCFVKQVGTVVYDNSGESRRTWPGLTQFQHHNGDADDECEVLLTDPKGGDLTELPEDLRVREVPT